MLTAKELIDLLVDYSVRHTESLPTESSGYYGLTDSEKKCIWIADDKSTEERRRTVIHEFLHAYHMEHHERIRHSQVYKEEEIVYQALFGVDRMDER
jgi:Zn-dependent peptidase ImmA (M78 family)